MNWLRLARARLFSLLHKVQYEAEMEEELRFHLLMRAQEHAARGLPPEKAAIRARRQFGNVARIKEEWRDVSGGGAFEAFLRDLRFAARMLAKGRAVVAVAVLALGLGIGANIALFTVMRSVLLRPLPYPEAHQLMRIWSCDAHHPGVSSKVSFPDFLDFQSRNHTFDSLGAFVATTFIINNNGGDATNVQAAPIYLRRLRNARGASRTRPAIPCRGRPSGAVPPQSRSGHAHVPASCLTTISNPAHSADRRPRL